MGEKTHLLLGVWECCKAKKQRMVLMRTQLFLVQSGALKSLVPTGTPYLVGSSLSLGENFIFFFLGSDEVFVTRIVEKKDISDGSGLGPSSIHRDVTLRTVQKHTKRVNWCGGMRQEIWALVPPAPLITCVTLKK